MHRRRVAPTDARSASRRSQRSIDATAARLPRRRRLSTGSAGLGANRGLGANPLGPILTLRAYALRVQLRCPDSLRELIRRASQRGIRCVWQFASIAKATILDVN